MASSLEREQNPGRPGADALAEGFERIRRQFVAGLTERRRAMDAAADEQQLQAVLHRLAGAAGAFGYDALGTLARQALEASQAGDGPALAQNLAILKRDMQQLAA